MMARDDINVGIVNSVILGKACKDNLPANMYSLSTLAVIRLKLFDVCVVQEHGAWQSNNDTVPDLEFASAGWGT